MDTCWVTKSGKIRKSEHLTVAALAQRAGVSESYISQLERGLVDPSVSLLRKLAFSLNVSVASFFDEDGEAPIITRREDRELASTEDGSVSFSWISPDAEGLRLEMVEITLASGCRMRSPANSHHTCLFLTEGSLNIAYQDTAAALQTGDSIFIPANTAFLLTNTAEGAARGILCVSKGGGNS